MVMVKDLLKDSQIQPGMMQSALSAEPSRFTPNQSIQLTESNDPIVPHKVPVSSAPNDTDTPETNKELNTYKDRPTIELNNFKKQLEMQSKIEVECANQI